MHAILDPIVEATLSILRSHGIWAVFVLMILESACIPAPSEVIMLFAGWLVWKGDVSMLEAVSAGVVGNVVGSVLMWYIAAYGGRAFIERHGRWVRLNTHHLDVSHRWFERWGSPAVFFGRMLPVIRTFISLPAGLARMPLGRFTLFTTLGCIPWVWGITAIGRHLGPDWENARDQLHKLDNVVIVAILLGIALLVVGYLRRRRAAAAPTG
jgi:membrane protein DedA with SNARE-associated domain